MKKLLILSALLLVACQKPTKISEKEVMDTFETFFEVLDNDLGSFDSMVTEDFFIFENSRRYSKEEFIAFVKSFDIVSSKRKFEDVTIDSDFNSAHISLKQYGEFIVNTPQGKTKLEFEWLESTYAVKQDGALKFKFYFSEAIKTQTTNLETPQQTFEITDGQSMCIIGKGKGQDATINPYANQDVSYAVIENIGSVEFQIRVASTKKELTQFLIKPSDTVVVTLLKNNILYFDALTQEKVDATIKYTIQKDALPPPPPRG